MKIDAPKSPARRFAPIVIVLACGLAYANSIPNDFVFDDLSIVKDNTNLDYWCGFSGLMLTNYWEAEQGADQLWRPTTMLTYYLNARVFGKAPWGFHWVNLLLHIVVALLVVRLSRAAGLGGAGAVGAGLAFALHPIHADAVSSIVGRAELLCAIFFLAALLAWLRCWRSRSVAMAALTGGLVFVALGSKENAATFPLAAALVVWILGDGVSWAKWRPAVCGAVAMAIALGVYLALRFWILGGLRYEPDQTFPGLLYGVDMQTRILTASAVFTRYGFLFLWPAKLSADYSFDAIAVVHSWTDPVALAGIALVVGLVFATMALRRRCPGAAFGFGLYLSTFALTSNFLLPIKSLMAERLAYLPSVGLAIAFGAGAQALWCRAAGRRRTRYALVALGAVLCLAWCGRTVARNRDWATNETLFASAARAYPGCSRAHFNLGDVARVDYKDYDVAIAHYKKALEIVPNDAQAWRLIGDCFYVTSRFEAAIEAYDCGLAIEPNDEALIANLETARGKLKVTTDN